MKTLSRYFFFILCLCFFQTAALAEEGQTVPEIHVKGISSSLVGNYLTAFYVSGREGVLQNPGHDLRVRTVFTTSTQKITGSTVTLPKINVDPTGFQAFNYVVFVIHKQNQVFLKRPDGDIVTDPRIHQGQTPDNSQFQFLKQTHLALEDLIALKISSQNFIEVDLRNTQL